MATAEEVMKKLKKDFGNSTVQMGNDSFADTPRIPTGIFPFDLATGGGFPMGRVSIVFGPESSNKTNIALKALGNAQRLYPSKSAVFVDAEGAYDPSWAELMGVDTKKLILITPEYAEQAVDMTEGMLYADDVSMVVLDSIAALVSQNEIESTSDGRR